MTQELMRAAEAGDIMDADMPMGDVASQSLSQSAAAAPVEAPAKNVITLTAESYQRIVQQVMFQIKKYERESGETGMHKSRIVDWFLESKEEEIESEEQMNQCRKMIKSVLNRLVKKVPCLLWIEKIISCAHTQW